MKNAVGILLGIALNVQIALGSIHVLTLLVLPIYEYGMSSHFFVSSPISFFFLIFIYL